MYIRYYLIVILKRHCIKEIMNINLREEKCCSQNCYSQYGSYTTETSYDHNSCIMEIYISVCVCPLLKCLKHSMTNLSHFLGPLALHCHYFFLHSGYLEWNKNSIELWHHHGIIKCLFIMNMRWSLCMPPCYVRARKVVSATLQIFMPNHFSPYTLKKRLHSMAIPPLN